MWICWGSVCGECDRNHQTAEAAQAHCAAHDRAVKRGHGQNAYSDRHPHLSDCAACTPGSNYVCRCPTVEVAS